VEFEPIKDRLLIEAGLTPFFDNSGHAEWDFDLVFRHPFELSKTVEFEPGIRCLALGLPGLSLSIGAGAMKVKTFTGTHRAAVDKQVNNWLAKSNVTVRKTNVAFKALRSRGWDAVTGKAVDRRALAVAITVWYEEALSPQNAPARPANWKFGLRR
jgi:hypothetical protein